MVRAASQREVCSVKIGSHDPLAGRERYGKMSRVQDEIATFGLAVHPGASSEAVSARMSRQARRDTKPEVLVRALLHAAGLRYRVAYPVPGRPRRTIDIAFTRRKVAVFLDGCFWHGCPVHGTRPKANGAWWVDKLRTNQARDEDTDRVLRSAGWQVLRFWEHEPAADVAGAVALAVRSTQT